MLCIDFLFGQASLLKWQREQQLVEQVKIPDFMIQLVGASCDIRRVLFFACVTCKASYPVQLDRRILRHRRNWYRLRSAEGKLITLPGRRTPSRFKHECGSSVQACTSAVTSQPSGNDVTASVDEVRDACRSPAEKFKRGQRMSG
eukprot:6066181-Karenia_brevis.AAC.1